MHYKLSMFLIVNASNSIICIFYKSQLTNICVALRGIRDSWNSKVIDTDWYTRHM